MTPLSPAQRNAIIAAMLIGVGGGVLAEVIAYHTMKKAATRRPALLLSGLATSLGIYFMAKSYE